MFRLMLNLVSHSVFHIHVAGGGPYIPGLEPRGVEQAWLAGSNCSLLYQQDGSVALLHHISLEPLFIVCAACQCKRKYFNT